MEQRSGSLARAIPSHGEQKPLMKRYDNPYYGTVALDDIHIHLSKPLVFLLLNNYVSTAVHFEQPTYACVAIDIQFHLCVPCGGENASGSLEYQESYSPQQDRDDESHYQNLLEEAVGSRDAALVRQAWTTIPRDLRKVCLLSPSRRLEYKLRTPFMGAAATGDMSIMGEDARSRQMY